MKKDSDLLTLSAGILTGIFTATSLVDNFLFGFIDHVICYVDKDYQNAVKTLSVFAILIFVYYSFYITLKVIKYIYYTLFAKINLQFDPEDCYLKCVELARKIYDDSSTLDKELSEFDSEDSCECIDDIRNRYIKDSVRKNVNEYYQCYDSLNELSDDKRYKELSLDCLRRLQPATEFVKKIDSYMKYGVFDRD